jgi:hypothetical protein
MKKTSLQFLKACSLSVALLGSVAIVAAVSMPDVAYAKSGNDNGGGKGNGGGNGHGGGNGNGGGKSDKAGGSNGKADKKSGGSAETTIKVKKAKKVTAKVVVEPEVKAKPKKKDILAELGVHPSELGALNAAHANPNALANASPNSRVGRIAAYRDSVLAGEELEGTLAEKEAAFGELDMPGRPSGDVQIELGLAAEETATAAGEVARLEAELEAAGGTDAAIEAELDAARSTLTTAQTAESTLQGEYDNAVAYETLEAEIADLEQQIEDQPELERSLLEAAANKPVTDEIEAAVKALLGL